MLVETNTTQEAEAPTAPLAAVGAAQSDAGNTPDAAAAEAPARPQRPEAIPADFWDDEKGLKTEEFAKAFSELKAKADERASAVPEKADGYELDAASFGLPEGVTLDMADPLAVAAREAAHKAGLTKTEFQDLAGVYVKAQLAEREAFSARLKEEHGKLGPQADKRIEAVTNALSGRLGEKGKALLPLMMTASAVEALEALIKQSGTSFSQSGRSEPDPGEIPGYDQMTVRQKMAAIDARKRA